MNYLKEDLIKKFEHSKYWLVSPVFENDPKYLLLTTSDDELHLLVWQERDSIKYRFTMHSNKYIFTGLTEAQTMSLNYLKLSHAIDEALKLLK